MLRSQGGNDELDGGSRVDVIDGGTGNVTVRDVAPDLDPLITAIIATPGTVQVNGPAHFSGQLIAGRLALTGGVIVHSKFEPAQL